MQKVIGLILLILGIGAIWWGYSLSESLSGEITQAVEGQDTGVMIRYAGGVVLIVVGLFLAMKKS